MLAHLLLIYFALLLYAATHFRERVLFLLYVLRPQAVQLQLLLLFQSLVVLLSLRPLHLILLHLPPQVLQLALQLVVVVLLGAHLVQVDFGVSNFLKNVLLSLFLDRTSPVIDTLPLAVARLLQQLLRLALLRNDHIELLLFLSLQAFALEQFQPSPFFV